MDHMDEDDADGCFMSMFEYLIMSLVFEFSLHKRGDDDCFL